MTYHMCLDAGHMEKECTSIDRKECCCRSGKKSARKGSRVGDISPRRILQVLIY